MASKGTEIYQLLVFGAMSVILFFAFAKNAFELGVLFGHGFVFTGLLSFYRSIAFRDLRTIGFVFIGMVVSMIATQRVLPEVLNSLLHGTFLAALITGGAGLAIYLRGKQIQCGDL